MDAFGVSGNLMSLGALDFGIIVDGSVVMVEHIVTRARPSNAGPSKAGASVPETVREAARSVARPVLFAVGIIMLVYVPILTLRGIEGKMFRPMALTVLFALGAAVVLSLTFMPAMATLVFRKGVKEKETWLMRAIRRVYEPALELHPATCRGCPIAAAGAVLVAACALVPMLGAEFIPHLDEGAIAMQAVRLPSVSLEESVRMSTTRIEQVLRERFPDEVETVISRTGRAEIATDPMGVELSDIYIMLKPRGRVDQAQAPKEELVDAIKGALEDEVPGQNYLFSQPIELRTNELISGVRSDVAIYVYGDDLDELARISDEMVRVLSGTSRAPPTSPPSSSRPALPRRQRRPRRPRSLRHQRRARHERRLRAGRRAGRRGLRRPAPLRAPGAAAAAISATTSLEVRDLPVTRPVRAAPCRSGSSRRIEQVEGPATDRAAKRSSGA